MLSSINSSSSFATALKSSLLCSKSENPAHYQTLIIRKNQTYQSEKDFVSYPTFSILDKLPETPINIPVINIKCSETCIVDLEHLITYLETCAYIKSVHEEYHCPICQQKIRATDYIIDYGYEYILRSYKRKLDLKNLSEQASKPNLPPNQQESSSIKATIPNGVIKINYQGDYTIIKEEFAKSHPLHKISQLVDKFQTEKITKFTNSMNIYEESKYDGVSSSLRLKSDYLLKFTKKFEEVTRPKISKLKRPFCFARLSSRPDRQIDVSMVANKLYLWFPSQEPGQKELSFVIDMIKDSKNYDTQDYDGLAYLIKIPEVGLWLTGGMTYKMNAARAAISDCYEIALRNITSLGKVRCERRPNLPTGTVGHSGLCVGDYVYVTGGSDGKNALTTAYSISWRNPKDGWIKLANMKFDKFYHSMSSTLDGKKIISVGGYYNYGNSFKGNGEIEQYDIELDKWTVLKLVGGSDTIIPTAYPFIHPVNKDEFFIWGGVDGALGTSIMTHYKLDVKSEHLRRDMQSIKTLQKAISDFIDMNVIWDKQGKLFKFLGPYRSERSKYSITLYHLNYETFLNRTERKLMYDLPRKSQQAAGEENQIDAMSSMIKSRSGTHAFK